MYLVKNVKLFDPQPMGKVDILVTNDRVAAVGNDLHPQIPGLTVIDGTGKTAVPGFIDQHVHVTGGGGEGGFNSRTPELMLSTVIKAGVTTLVGLLGTDSYTKSVENVLAKTKEFNADGITAYCLTGAYVYPPVTVTGSVSKDIVYIKEILGCKLAISDHRCSRPTKEELIRLASDIRMAALISGKPGILHIHLGGCGRQLEDIIEIVEEAYLPIKHFRPTHLDCNPKAALRFMELGGWADFTAEPSKTDELYDVMQKAGIEHLTVSSDSNGSIPVWNEARDQVVAVKVGGMDPLYEIIRNLVVDFNVPMETAIQLITSNVAKALELYPEKGTVRPGSHADMVLLDENLHIDTVMAMGKLMMKDKQLLAKGAFEEVPIA
ncbi:beta-aspartyl-peptidase [Hungatella sp.]|uniref:beta-aspartyl-peptidase n=1 Tax=Hungatella sp. TaxID=2613924 RepID=UPI003993880B